MSTIARTVRVARTLMAGVLGFSWACSGGPDLRPVLQEVDGEAPLQEHIGPDVVVTDSGTARFVRALYEAYQPRRAFELVGFIDRYYRAPANEGYDEVLNKLAKTLREAGFDGEDPRLSLELLDVAEVDAWTPVSGELVLLVDGQEPRVLHSFKESADVDRVMLPVHAPSCDVTAEVALALEDVKKGMVLVTEVPAAQVIPRAKSRGAAAVISASLEPFNQDPVAGGERHLDAIQFRTHPPGQDMPTAQVSPRSLQLIGKAVEDATKRGAKVRLRFRAETIVERRPLRTLMAMIEGEKHPEQAIALVSHVQEPGACDNATGVAGLAEGALSLVELLNAKKLAWPGRTLVFLWGDEFRQSESWLATTDLEPVVGISSDMTGQSKETHAIALLERNPDPGAIKVLEPDFHTPWGAGQVNEDEVKKTMNGLPIIARCAMIDVSLLEGGKWKSAEHPWEGGSDHDIFIARGIPAVLFWHFTDFTYHTSLDRMGFVDPEEMRRTGVALLATALGVACAEPTDVDRYIDSLEREKLLRMDKAMEFNDGELAKLWEEWSIGAREWLRNLCLGIDEKIPR